MAEVVTKSKFEERKAELMSMKKGWYNDEIGEPISESASNMLDLVSRLFLSFPYLYPTVVGGFSMEWDEPNITMEIDKNGTISGWIP